MGGGVGDAGDVDVAGGVGDVGAIGIGAEVAETTETAATLAPTATTKSKASAAHDTSFLITCLKTIYSRLTLPTLAPLAPYRVGRSVSQSVGQLPDPVPCARCRKST